MDPSGKRARNVVLLVVLTIAVPSLLLTGLAAVAVGNEASAAKSRLEREYKPVLQKTADRFNAVMDQILAEADSLLAAMARSSAGDDAGREKVGDDPLVRREIGEPLPELAASVAAPYAVNPFVVDEEGALRVPLRPPHGEDPTRPLPPPFREALAHELSHAGKPDACARWAALAGGGCLASLARAWCERGEGPGASATGCEELEADPLVPDLLALRRRAADPEAFLAKAEALSRRMASPSLSTSAWLLELAARDVAGRLKSLPESRRATLLGRRLGAIAERPALLQHVSQLTHTRGARTAVLTAQVEGWHRVFVARPEDGAIAGFELVASAFDPVVQEAIEKADPPLPSDALVWPLLVPGFWTDKDWMKEEDKVAAYALLKKSNMAWELLLVPREASLLGLQRSRARLLLWSLLLVVAALVAGIAYTVRAVVQEARESRLKVDFVSSVSHDLRTPLTSIRMFTETLLLGRVRDPKEVQESLQVIAQETERLTRLTQRILDFSRMEAGRKAYSLGPEPVAALVQRALDACRPLVEQGGFQVEVAIAPEVGTVVADRDALVEVLVNLLTNAIKYSPDQRFLRVAARVDGPHLLLSVEDQGIGIPKAEQAKIFEKFYRVDCRRTAEVGGSGIGLSLVQHIVKAHRGEVEVTSEPGRGSTFTVRLPVSPGATDGEHPGGRG